MSEVHKLLGAVEIGLEVGLVRTVVHNGRKACVHGLEAILIGTMIEVQSNRNRNVESLNASFDHIGTNLVAAHPLGSAARALHDKRRLGLLGSLENSERPFQVVGVEGAQTVMAGFSILKHVACVNEHTNPLVRSAEMT